MKKLTLIAACYALSISCVHSGNAIDVPKVLIPKKPGKFITVAVIDTGLEPAIMSQGYAKGICKMGHKDFSGKGLADWHGHGTNISGLIHKYAKGTNYCQVIISYYDDTKNNNNMENMRKAIRYAIQLNVDFINISGGGLGANNVEKEAIQEALDKGITVVAAAGNEGSDLDGLNNAYYPAEYDSRIVVVGNGKTSDDRALSSNWGKSVDYWIDGVNKVGDYGEPMTGTSQSTAIQTGKLVRQHVQNR